MSRFSIILFVLLNSCNCQISDRIAEIPNYYDALKKDDYYSNSRIMLRLTCCDNSIFKNSKVIVRIDDFCVYSGNYTPSSYLDINLPVKRDKSGYLIGVQVGNFKTQKLYKWGSDSYINFNEGKKNTLDLMYLGTESPPVSLKLN